MIKSLWIPLGSSPFLAALHMVVCKLAHLTEYGILARLWLHGMLAWRRTTIRYAMWVALLVCAVCAVADEVHQSMLPTRTGSVVDVALDCLGALLVLMLLRPLRQRSHGVRAHAGA